MAFNASCSLHMQQLLMLRHCLFAAVGDVMPEEYASAGLMISDCQMSGLLLRRWPHTDPVVLVRSVGL